jgi:hypothetical protein
LISVHHIYLNSYGRCHFSERIHFDLAKRLSSIASSRWRWHHNALFNMSKCDSPLAEIIRRQCHRYLIPGEYANPVLTHFSGSVGLIHGHFPVRRENANRAALPLRSRHFKQIFLCHRRTNPGMSAALNCVEREFRSFGRLMQAERKSAAEQSIKKGFPF